MAMNTGAFSYLIAPGLRKVYFARLKKWVEEYSKILTVETSKKAYEEEMIVAGLGRYVQKPEGEGLVYDAAIQGEKRRYTHITFSLGYRVTREMKDDELYGVMNKMSSELARSAEQTVELEVGSMVDDAFTGASVVGADGVALCHATHPLLVGGTYANKPAVDLDFGVGALRASVERMERTVTERGLPAMLRGSKVIVSPTFQWVAMEMLDAGTTKAPYTSENQVNAFRKFGIDYMVYHYGSDDDAWFLQSSKDDHTMKFFWRQRPMFENGDDFDSKDAKFSGWMRFSYGFTDWRGIDGSSGG